MGLNNGTKAESWEISQRNGKPGIFTRNGKEWFDADKAWASQSGEYYILTGMDANANEGIAIATKASGIRIRKTEELIEDAVITDDGIGYALSDEGTLFTLVKEKPPRRNSAGRYPRRISPLSSALWYTTPTATTTRTTKRSRPSMLN